MNKKIYVALAVLFNDDDLISTIDSLYKSLSDKHDVHIHVAFTGIKSAAVHLKGYYDHKDITFSMHPFVMENIGVGKGRKHSMSGYRGEDYVLQIDPHTAFEPNWDIDLVNRLNEAIKLTNNEKTILTCYLSNYEYDKDLNVVSKFEPRYPVFNKTKWCVERSVFFGQSIPSWTLYDPDQIPEGVIAEGFAPAVKFNANFAFGNKEFARYTGVYEDAMFLDEEIPQSVNLIGAGFCLVYPYGRIPLAHKYLDSSNDGARTSLGSIIDESILREQMAYGFLKFMTNEKNFENIKKYQEYANIDLTYNVNYMDSGSTEFYPKNYINSKEDNNAR